MGGLADACDDCGFTVHVMDVTLAAIAPKEYLLVSEDGCYVGLY